MLSLNFSISLPIYFYMPVSSLVGLCSTILPSLSGTRAQADLLIPLFSFRSTPFIKDKFLLLFIQLDFRGD